MRIIDAQQIVYQEPRVAFKNAALIQHGEISKEYIRELQDKRRIKDLKRVSKASRLAKKKAVSNSRGSGKKHIDISV